MSNVIEIKAMSKEQAITRALKRMEATPDQIVKITEKQKSRSLFLGLFEREGIYEIEIEKNVEKKEKPEARELKKEVKTEPVKEVKKKEIKEHKEHKVHKEAQVKENTNETLDASKEVEALLP